MGAFSLVLPLTHYTESKHELAITVVAPNPPLAATKAVQEADEYLAALSLAVGEQRYLFQPTVAEKLLDSSGSDPHQYVPSGAGVASVFYPETLNAGDEWYVKTLLQLSRENRTFGRVVGDLRAAWRLRDVPLTDPAIHKAVLSNCFLVLETVANEVTKDWRKSNKEATRVRQQTVVHELAEKLKELGGTDDVQKKVAVVREAYRDLQRADRFFQNLKLKTAGRMLGVEKRFVEPAVELSELRNKKLNHPGSIGAEDIDEWIYKPSDPRLSGDEGHFGKGEQTALAYLKAYATHLEAEDEST